MPGIEPGSARYLYATAAGKTIDKCDVKLPIQPTNKTVKYKKLFTILSKTKILLIFNPILTNKEKKIIITVTIKMLISSISVVNTGKIKMQKSA